MKKDCETQNHNHLAMNLVKWNLDFFSSSSGPPSTTLYFTPCMIIILKSYVKSTPFHDIIANSVHNDFRTFFFSPPVQNLLLKLSISTWKKRMPHKLFLWWPNKKAVYFCNRTCSWTCSALLQKTKNPKQKEILKNCKKKFHLKGKANK